jgi:Cu(I)/Ag(I) efflux system membrane fusion protein
MDTKTWKLGAAALVLLAVGVAIGWSLSPQKHVEPAAASAPAAKQERKVLYWYDPMQPTQKFDQPGKSPFMDMQHTPRYADEEAGAAAGVAVSPQAVQSLGLRVARVETMAVGASVDAVGSLQLSERDVAIVQARSAGFVERVYARAPGDVIAAGAPLADLLLPDWVAAQREFLAVKALADDSLTAAARQRLALLGMSAALIAKVERTGQVQATNTVVAPIGGVISELAVRPGMTVSAGMTLARINGLGTLWLDVAVPEAQAAAVRPGQAAQVRFAAFPGEVFKARIALVLPESNRESRTLRVRIELPNPGQRLKTGMFAQVALLGPQTQALVVPSEAVIRTGRRSLVYVVEGPGRYRPVEIDLGPELDGKLVVRRGLEPGQEVVASAQFLVDSEASLKGIGAAAPAAPVARSPSAPAAPSYSSTGKVVELAGDSVMISHAAIPALRWPAMTMGFKVTDAGLKDRLKVGQAVSFSFVQQGDDYLLTQAQPAAAAGSRP